MMELDGVVIDSQVVELALEYLASPSESLLSEVASLPAAIKTHNHAQRFGNTDASVLDFWRKILSDAKEQQPRYERQIRANLSYLNSNESSLLSAIREIEEYLPSDYSLETRLNLILGYDIGIVSEGEAMLNVAHPYFSRDKRELIYLAMHELHHVGFTDYHPIYSLADLQRMTDLRDAIRYSTHLEGLAVYAPLERRIEENGLDHEDYQLMLDSDTRQLRVREYFEILENVEETPNRELTESDFEIMDKMSRKGSRLWYVTGGYMSKIIDETLGREALLRTIVGGPEIFFDSYERAKNAY